MASGAAFTIHADTAELEESLERAIRLAERFREVWGDDRRPDGMDQINVGPGDVLVFRYDGELTQDQLRTLRANAEREFAVRCIFLTGGMRIEGVVRRPEGLFASTPDGVLVSELSPEETEATRRRFLQRHGDG